MAGPEQPGGCGGQGGCGSEECGSAGSWGGASRSRPGPADPKKCLKCRTADATVMARQREPTCWDCLYSQVAGKVQPNARGKGIVVEGDFVLAAVSGGVGSTAMLHLLGGMRSSQSARKERSKVRFRLEALHIDEGAAHGLSAEARQAHVAAVTAAAPVAAPGGGAVHVVALEEVFAKDRRDKPGAADAVAHREACRAQLLDLLASVPDTTGREDLIAHLRDELLRATARRLGATKLALGSSATRCAVATIEMTCKGKGYALPGSIQYRDGREGGAQPIVCLPVRDIGSKELALVCHQQRLPLCPLPVLPSAVSMARSINRLSAHFVAGLQERLPSSVPTILGTSSKLVPFGFNGVPERVQGKLQPVAAGSDPLCALCRAPLTPNELHCLAAAASEGVGAGSAGPACCLACRSSVLAADAGAEPTATAALLPQSITERSDTLKSALASAGHHGGAHGPEHLRQRIAEFLLDEAEDDD